MASPGFRMHSTLHSDDDLLLSCLRRQTSMLCWGGCSERVMSAFPGSLRSPLQVWLVSCFLEGRRGRSSTRNPDLPLLKPAFKFEPSSEERALVEDQPFSIAPLLLWKQLQKPVQQFKRFLSLLRILNIVYALQERKNRLLLLFSLFQGLHG